MSKVMPKTSPMAKGMPRCSFSAVMTHTGSCLCQERRSQMKTLFGATFATVEVQVEVVAVEVVIVRVVVVLVVVQVVVSGA
mmetsp:Transcript_67038/g.82125  ORF Transcript_67038/g.82125 Transcript_67038/m.82125 type:complete len:81 (+) Transcript_67038:265-507(+)